MPVLCEETLPWSLWMRFELEERDRLLAVLQFLRPITTAAWKSRLCEVHSNSRRRCRKHLERGAVRARTSQDGPRF
jgi:hypothetical protein